MPAPHHPAHDGNEGRDGRDRALDAVHAHDHAQGHDHEHLHDDHHDAHAHHSAEAFRDLFWVSLLLTVPTLVWSEALQSWLGYSAPVFPGSKWIEPVFGTAVFLYGGRVFLRGAVDELQDRLPGMMTLISLAITVAFVYSLTVLLGWSGMALWWELATLVTIMLLGHWMEMRSIQQASGALQELAKLLPDTALRLVDGRAEEVPVTELVEGDVVLVRPGASVPADGEVREGRSSVNEAMITGESRPVEKVEGDEVIAGTVNGSGSLRVVVTGTGEGTALAGIMRMVADAQASRSRAQDLADRAARYLTFVAIGAGVLTLVAWIALGAPRTFTIERVVTVLVIACPHALGLAIPLVVAISTTLGARNGLLVRDRRALEEARELDVVVFDKTGTLTRGEFTVVDVATVPGLEPDEALWIAAAVEHDSEHAIARGIVRGAEERGVRGGGVGGGVGVGERGGGGGDGGDGDGDGAVVRARDFEAIPGKGVSATVDGRRYHVGGPALLREFDVALPESLREAVDRASKRGQAAVILLEDHAPRAAFTVADPIRPEAHDAVRRLREMSIDIVMLTGDARPVAEAVAAELGIETVVAEVLPEDKVDRVWELRAGGRRVAMVGDGVNDAPALLNADVGIAIGAGTDVAVESGDVVLVRSDPRDVPRIIELSRATYRKMIQNLWWAAGYNIVALPLAAGVLAGKGILLAPAFGAILMSVSTVIVALNAQSLRRVGRQL